MRSNLPSPGKRTARSLPVSTQWRIVQYDTARYAAAWRIVTNLTGRTLPFLGTIQHPGTGEPWEYAIVVQIYYDQGETISRHVMGAGALPPAASRTFTVRVEVFAPQKSTV